jgi:hypothetical protein
MPLLVGGLAASVAGVVVVSSIGLPENVASVLVALCLVPLLAALVLAQVRLRRAVLTTPSGQAWRRLPLGMRVAPPTVFLLAVPIALVLRAEGAPRFWRTLAFVACGTAAVLTQRFIQRRRPDSE